MQLDVRLVTEVGLAAKTVKAIATDWQNTDVENLDIGNLLTDCELMIDAVRTLQNKLLKKYDIVEKYDGQHTF